MAGSLLLTTLLAWPPAAIREARAAESTTAALLQDARASWAKGSLEHATVLYRQALEQGGLAPDEVLEGYVRLGAARAATGKKDQALAAFRAASILDADFEVPPQAGRKGAAIANQAKKETARLGSLKLEVRAPKTTPAGKTFTVHAEIDAPHVPAIAKVALVARDGTTGKETTVDVKPAAALELEVPASMTLPDASLLVRVDALDAHQNRLASAEERVHVDPAPPPEAIAKASAPKIIPEARTGSGFWSSPWPYVIGGIALAGAGAATYFGTRPIEQVSVGAVDVRSY